MTRQPVERQGDETGTRDAAQPTLKVDGTTDIVSARGKPCLPRQAPRNTTPLAMQERLKHRASSTNDQGMSLDLELLSESIHRIQSEVPLPTLDAGEVPSRHAELFSKTFLRQPTRNAQIAHLRSKHLLQRFCHTTSLGSGSHDFQEVIASSRGRGRVARDSN